MSMNFGREQSLLRQRLGAAASAEVAAATSPGLASGTTCLGAPPAAIAAAASDLLANHPQMGRAQMTAFVRTLWQSKIHELRAVGIAVLAARIHLLEAADLPVVEKLLADAGSQDQALLTSVVGPLVARHKKLGKDLERLSLAGDAGRRAAAIAAFAPVVAAQADGFARFAKFVEKLLPSADPELWRAVDAVLAAAAPHARDAVVAFAQRHGRQVAMPSKVSPSASEAPVELVSKSDAGRSARGDSAKGRTAAATEPSAAKAAAAKPAKPSRSRGAPKSTSKPVAAKSTRAPKATKPASGKAKPASAQKKLARRG